MVLASSEHLLYSENFLEFKFLLELHAPLNKLTGNYVLDSISISYRWRPASIRADKQFILYIFLEL